MNFKLLTVSVACFAVLVQPAHSAGLISSIGNTVSGLASIPIKLATVPFTVAKAKTSAVVKGVTDVSSTLVNGAGLKLRALATAASTINDAVADGLIAVGDSISKAGNEISTSLSNSDTIGNTRVLIESPVEDNVFEEVDIRLPTAMEQAFTGQEIIEIPVESGLQAVELKVREPMAVYETARVPFGTNKVSAVWETLNRAVPKVYEDGIVDIRRVPRPVAYEIVEVPRGYEKPVVEAYKSKKQS